MTAVLPSPPDLSQVVTVLREAIAAPLLIRQVNAPGYVGVSRPGMFRLIAAGQWPDPVDVPGSGIMYRRADLDKWVAKLRSR